MPSNDIQPLTLAVHAMAPPTLDASRRTKLGRLKMLGVLAFCALPVIASYFTYFFLRPDARTNYSELITPPRALPSGLPLSQLTGESVVPDSLKGQWLLVAVGDSACNTVCEKNLLLQRQLRETLGREKDRIDKVWLVTDEGNPRPELMTALASGPTVTVLRAPATALGQWLSPAGAAPLSDHLYLVDPLGQWMMRVPVNPEPARLKRDVERLLRASSSWDKPGR